MQNCCCIFAAKYTCSHDFELQNIFGCVPQRQKNYFRWKKLVTDKLQVVPPGDWRYFCNQKYLIVFHDCMINGKQKFELFWCFYLPEFIDPDTTDTFLQFDWSLFQGCHYVLGHYLQLWRWRPSVGRTNCLNKVAAGKNCMHFVVFSWPLWALQSSPMVCGSRYVFVVDTRVPIL